MELNSNNSSKIKIKGPENPGIAAFRAEIGKSAVKLQNSDIKPKSKVGRPSNAEKAAKEAAEQAQKEAVFEEQVPKEALGAILQCPFEVAAVGTGFDGFRLTDQEAMGLIPSFHAVMKRYAPAVNPDDLAIGMFGLGITSLALTKYRSYQMWLAEQSKPKQKAATPASMPIPGTPIT